MESQTEGGVYKNFNRAEILKVYNFFLKPNCTMKVYKRSAEILEKEHTDVKHFFVDTKCFLRVIYLIYIYLVAKCKGTYIVSCFAIDFCSVGAFSYFYFSAF